MLSGNDSTKIRDQVIGVLTKFNTPTLNLESQIVQPGYTRTFKQCLFVDKSGKMQEMELVVEFIRGYILEDQLEVPENELNKFYNFAIRKINLSCIKKEAEKKETNENKDNNKQDNNDNLENIF